MTARIFRVGKLRNRNVLPFRKAAHSLDFSICSCANVNFMRLKWILSGTALNAEDVFLSFRHQLLEFFDWSLDFLRVC